MGLAFTELALGFGAVLRMPFMSDLGSTTVHLVGPGELLRCMRAIVELGLPLSQVRHQQEGEVLNLSARLDGALPTEKRMALEAWARAAGLVSVISRVEAPRKACVSVTLLGNLRQGQALETIIGLIEGLGLYVGATRPIGERGPRGLELLVSCLEGTVSEPKLRALRTTLLGKSLELDVDVAVERNDFYRKNRRLVCMDVDSTFVQGEFIDELAELAGVKAQVAEITARAMRGELDFSAALRERVRLLKGLPMARALGLCERYVPSPGAEDLVSSLKRLGVRVGLVSGGFDFFVERLRDRYGLDFAFANQLEVVDDHLTGEVLGSIVDGQRKGQVLRDMASVFSIDVRQTIAVGDGANDIFMLEAAGLGIAYQAKPKLLAHADACFRHHNRLDTLLYLMGFDAPEVKDACALL
jgi:phosphoserine phosphatase